MNHHAFDGQAQNETLSQELCCQRCAENMWLSSKWIAFKNCSVHDMKIIFHGIFTDSWCQWPSFPNFHLILFGTSTKLSMFFPPLHGTYVHDSLTFLNWIGFSKSEYKEPGDPHFVLVLLHMAPNLPKLTMLMKLVAVGNYSLVFSYVDMPKTSILIEGS